MKILALKAENVKRLRAVEIRPNGSDMVVVAGENEAGKSSVLDSIAYALGGKALLPSRPIRDGQSHAEVRVDLGDYIVTRTFTAAGGGSLAVTNRDGAKFPSPQALLDGLVGKLSFDPLAFAGARPEEQAATLRALAGLDTSDIEAKRKAAYEQRTLANRDVTQAQGAVAKLPKHDDVGTEPQRFDELTRELEAADSLATKAAEAERAVVQAVNTQRLAADRVRQWNSEIRELQAKLEAAEQSLEDAEVASAVADDKLVDAKGAREKAVAAVPDRVALRAKIGAINEHNRKVAENQRRAECEAQVTTAKAKADKLTTTINDLDAEKEKRLRAAKFPLEGLSVDDVGVTWKGLPFTQASQAVRTKVSVAIGLALNPKLKVLLVRNGNDLDAKSLKALADTASEADAQLWVERIEGGNGLHTIVIEDGAIAERR